MRANLGKSLSREEMKQIQGGKYPGCATQGENGNSYSQGCCTGLIQCTVSNQCEVPGTCPPCPTC